MTKATNGIVLHDEDSGEGSGKFSARDLADKQSATNTNKKERRKGENSLMVRRAIVSAFSELCLSSPYIILFFVFVSNVQHPTFSSLSQKPYQQQYVATIKDLFIPSFLAFSFDTWRVVV
jgi:hypothetical protein